jgi:hypothetical protein
MRTHITVIGVLNIILGLLTLLGGVILLVPGLMAAVTIPFIGLLGPIAGLIVIGIGIFSIAAGQGLMNLAPWARIAMIVLSIIHLVNMTTFGFTTALGIYTLIILFLPETEKMFQRGY